MARLLAPLEVFAGTRALDLLPALARALAGEGPALLPIPVGTAPPPGLRAGELLDAAEDEAADPTALIVATSGSTGTPKGVLLPASALRASATATTERLGGPGRWLLALPVQHIAGIQVLVRSLLAGTEPIVLGDGFDPGALAAATDRLGAGRRYTALVPTQLVRALADERAAAALATYDAVLVGGAAATAALLGQARGAGIPVVVTYGMTETCGGCVYDGSPLRDVRVDTTDGRVRLGGPVLARGYRGRPDLTAQSFVEGWFRTADNGRWDADRLEVLGRIDDMMITGGANVAPADVEAALASHPDVREVAVLGWVDPLWGQRVVAVIVPRDPVAPPALPTLRAHVSKLAGGYAAPRELVVLDALPMLAAGKIDRAALRTLRGEIWGG